MSIRYLIVIEGDGSTNYSAYSPDLPGVADMGATHRECEEQIREAIAFHIEGMKTDGLPVPPPNSISSYGDIRGAEGQGPMNQRCGRPPASEAPTS